MQKCADMLNIAAMQSVLLLNLGNVGKVGNEPICWIFLRAEISIRWQFKHLNGS